MYRDEERTTFSLKNIILQILIVLLFLFLLMWIFPTRNGVNKKIKPFYNRLFNENVMIMKEAAKSYYTLERLPKNIGDKVQMTLGEMYELKIILPFSDSNGNQCDVNQSYVEVTKMDEEYVMKVNLKCSDNEDYLLVHMGCYDYCKTTLCENKDDKDVGINTPTRPSITVPDTKPTPTPTPNPEITYRCLYEKVTDAKPGDWGPWSDWSETIAYQTTLQKVETRERTVVTEEQVIVDYKVIVEKDYDKPIYTKYQVATGSIEQKKCVEEGKEYVHTGEYKYTDWVSQGLKRSAVVLKGTDTMQYEIKSTGIDDGCGECNNGLYYMYEVFSRKKYEIVKENIVCTKYDTISVPTYATVEILTGYETKTRKEPVYETKKVETKIKEYRYATRKMLSGSPDRKWSNCTDNALLNKGYEIIQKEQVK